MMWVAMYFACGVAWWFGNADFKEHVDFWKGLPLLGKLVYVMIQLVLVVLLWPISIVGWAITKGLFGKRVKTELETKVDDIVRDMDDRKR